jgi:hypothetical protein
MYLGRFQRDLVAQQARDDVKSHADACRDTAGRDDLSVVDYPEVFTDRVSPRF